MTLHALLIQPFVEFGFMRRALVATLALGLACGPMGTLLVLRRMSLAGDAIAHALLPGAALAWGSPPRASMIPASCVGKPKRSVSTRRSVAMATRSKVESMHWRFVMTLWI